MKKFLSTILIALFTIVGIAVAETEDKYMIEGQKTLWIETDEFCMYLTGDYLTGENFNGIDGNYIFRINCEIENKCDKILKYISYDLTVNDLLLGVKHSMGGIDELQPNATAQGYIWFDTDSTNIHSFEELKTMRAVITAVVKDDRALKEETDIIHFNAEIDAADEFSNEVPTDNEPIIIYGAYEALENGSKGNEVKQLQQALIDRGFLTGNADGIFGNGTAASVKAFQESINLEPTGVADDKTQAELFGGIDVRPALMEEIWYANGGSDTTLNVLRFAENTVKIRQIVYDGNGRHLKAENDYPYILNKNGIAITLSDGSELKISFAASGNRLILNDHEYWSATEVNEKLQGYWKLEEVSNVLGPSIKREEHVYLGDDIMKYEFATEGINLGKGEYYYYGPYEASYTLGLACFEIDMYHGNEFSFNIIDNVPVLLRYSHVFEHTEEKFPGQNGYKF